ncbi:glutathione S-transferase [Auriscalpium vulgare]|uniref:Glutathione S-transferase n=1 Tax=Auriscalpium vulgare TaxID=40419 RepID=A0ACB8RXE5_9AGAM|nr:glutathione S-transferase [Auriscalpium vulgare]
MSIAVCTRRVAVVAREAGIPYELVGVDYHKAEHKTLEFLEHQPFGLVPYIQVLLPFGLVLAWELTTAGFIMQDEDGFELYESRAISRYIATMKQSKAPALVPKARKANALFEQAASIEQNNFDPLASALADEKIFGPMNGVQPNEARVAELVQQMKGKLELGKQNGTQEITLADLFHLPYGALLVETALGLIEERPNVNRWLTDISTRLAWLAVKGGA